MRLSGHGLAADLPARWEGRVFRPNLPPPALNFPVLHAGSFRLPADEASFGSEAARAMGGHGVFVALIEYDPTLGGFGLFGPRGLPAALRLADFDPHALQVTRPGQAGYQRFMTTNGRALCLYVVLGAGLGAQASLREANRVLSSVSIAPGGAAG